MTSPSEPLTTQQTVALLRHLAGGKDLDTVAEIMHITRDGVFAIAHSRGYPDPEKLDRAANLLAKEAADDELRASIPTSSSITPGLPVTPPTVAQGGVSALSKPDEIRILLNTAKAHPAKRIQAAADRVFDQIDKLRTLIREDQEKNSEKRKREAEKAAARAEVERLEKQLAAAKAKLRGKPSPQPTAATADSAGGKAKRQVSKRDITCPDCQTTLHTTDAGMRMHRMRAHQQAAS